MRNLSTKILSILVILLLSSSVFSQKNKQEYTAPDIPKSPKTGLISYSGVVEQAGTAKELKEKAMKWYRSYFKNSANILKKNTETEFSARPRFKIVNPKDKKGVATMAGTILYTIDLKFKDGKYRYELTNIIKKAQSKYPIEKWLNTQSKTYKNVYAYYLIQVDEHMKKVISDLKKAMAAEKQENNDDW